MSRRINYLRPEEVPEESRAALDFEGQARRRTNSGFNGLHIERTCRGCGKKKWILVNVVRQHKRKFTGYCRKCVSTIWQRDENNPCWKGGGALRTLRGLKRAAARRGYRWELDDYYATYLLYGCCFYCGTIPKMNNRGFLYNSIDRVDNSKGYIVGNVVTCCKRCNLAKHIMCVEDWLAHCKLVISRESEILEKIHELGCD